MRKSNMVTIGVLGAVGVAAFVFLADPFDLAGSGGVDDLADMFMEDLQFKDFKRAASYHSKLERDRIDIGRSLESLFKVKPEMLDIQRYEIVRTNVDSTGERATTVVRMVAQRLNIDKEPMEKDLKLYWSKFHPDCPFGGVCGAQSVCVDSAGEVMHPLEADENKAQEIPGQASDAEAREEDKTYACDPSLEPQWFMNLDSTLKEKPYR